jgi:hypothetical protein
MRNLTTLAIVLAVLSACDNTSVAFCSGGEDFCENFIVKIGGDDEEEDEEEEEEDENEGEAASAPVEAALKIARLTPRAVDSALGHAGMQRLASSQPELLGLWLINTSLARLWQQNDNVATARFLNQNRLWLYGAQGPTPADQMLAAGLDLFADVAADLEPESAMLARAKARAAARINARTTALGPGGRDESAEVVVLSNKPLARTVLAAAADPENCCAARQLAAAALVLCEASDAAAGLPALTRQRACGRAAWWIVANQAR